MNMKQSCKALICAIEGELDGRHCTEEQAAAILDHALPSLTETLARVRSELSEAVRMLREIESTKIIFNADKFELNRRLVAFLAQAEQQEAQGAQAGDERAAFESAWSKRLDLSRDKLSGCYYSQATEWRWEGWQARAAQPAVQAHASEFQREDRYIVIKRKDLQASPFKDRVNFLQELAMLEAYLPKREYLVIESDWPEYEPTWAAIQARVEGRAAVRGDEHE